MSNPIDFETLAQGLAVAGVPHSPSELQGVMAGLLATGHGAQDEEVLGILASHTDIEGGFDGALAGALMRVRDQLAQGYEGTGLELTLLLPADEDDLGLRVAAVAQWCEGFLVGFGTGSANTRDKDLSPGIQEALSDLAAISQVATPEESGDEEEDMFEQVAEHCRMAALMIYTELVMRHQGKPVPEPATPPTRH
ncbi:MAG: YecA family protein [Pseudomonadota bacterium]|nr:YecA family protein [Pseudomonadota bacterium]